MTTARWLPIAGKPPAGPINQWGSASSGGRGESVWGAGQEAKAPTASTLSLSNAPASLLSCGIGGRPKHVEKPARLGRGQVPAVHRHAHHFRGEGGVKGHEVGRLVREGVEVRPDRVLVAAGHGAREHTLQRALVKIFPTFGR